MGAGLAGEGGSFPLGGEGSREPASRTCPSTHTEVPLAAAAAAAAGPQGHELASEGPLCLIVGLPTSTDLPPEGRSSTHAQAQPRPSNVLPFVASHVPTTTLFVILRPIPFGDNWFHVAAAAGSGSA